MTINQSRRRTSIGLTVALWTGLAIWLSGCASATNTAPSVTPTAAVMASASELAAIGKLITACYAQPSCANAVPKQQVRGAFDAAYDAVTQAQSVADAGGTPTMTEVAATMSVLQGLVAKLPPVQPVPPIPPLTR